MDTIPIINLKNIQDTSTPALDPEWVSTSEQIRDGLSSVGFMYVKNHGIPEEVISEMFSQSKQFFQLPQAIKQKYLKDTSNFLDFYTFHGYTTPGGELLNADSTHELRESYDWFIGRGIYPTEELPQFELTFSRLDSQCKILLKKLLRLIALSLKLADVDYFVNKCRHFDEPDKYTGLYNLKMLYYPPVSKVEQVGKGIVRCGEHTDAQLLTLLFQDDIGGLEIKTLNNEWIDAKPIPGTILVNTGDLIEFWTSGIFPATLHRVSVPDILDSRRDRSRYSVAFFNGPDDDVIVTPLEVEKRENEKNRLAISGKVYNKNNEPILAVDHVKYRLAGLRGLYGHHNHE